MYDLSLGRIRDTAASTQRVWAGHHAKSAPTWTNNIVEQLGSYSEHVVPFVFGSEPTSRPEWDNVFASAADLNALGMLHLPYPAVYFEFNANGPGRGPKCAAIVQEVDGLLQVHCYIKAGSWQLIPVVSIVVLTALTEHGVPSALVDLRTGERVDQSADSFLAALDAGRHPAENELAAHVLASASELAVWLVVALSTQGIVQESVPAPERLNARKTPMGAHGYRRTQSSEYR